MADYITAEELRAEAEVPKAALSDAKAAKLIRTAQTLVELALGRGPRQASGPQEGRLIAEADVQPYQWENLKACVAVLAARIFRQPDLVAGGWESVSGPDFSRSGPMGRIFGDEAAALLKATDLVPRSARARS